MTDPLAPKSLEGFQLDVTMHVPNALALANRLLDTARGEPQEVRAAALVAALGVVSVLEEAGSPDEVWDALYVRLIWIFRHARHEAFRKLKL